MKNLIVHVSSDDNISVNEDDQPRRDDQDPIPFTAVIGNVTITVDYDHPGWTITATVNEAVGGIAKGCSNCASIVDCDLVRTLLDREVSGLGVGWCSNWRQRNAT